MSTTLISFIGTGMYNEKEGGYRKTIYQFSNGTTIETPLFLKAILDCNLYNFSQICIVGTKSSDWGALIYGNEIKYKSLSEKLLEKRINANMDHESALELEKALFDIYKIEFKIFYHTDEIDNTTTQEVFNIYKEISKNINKGNRILLDITHGFRSMPILLYQSLQYSFQNYFDGAVSIIYGEYIPDKKISKVRDLSSYLEFAEVASGFKLFNERLDGRILAEKCKETWPKMAKWLNRFTGVVQTNYFLQISELVRNLRNVLDEGLPKDHPSWMADLYNLLLDICNRLKDKKDSRMVLKFSQMLSEKKLFTQAVIALQVSVEILNLEYYDSLNELGNYNYYQEKIKPKLKELLKKENLKGIREKIYNLEYARNQIAHGGAKNPETGGFPQAENISAQYNSAKNSVTKLFDILEK